MPLGNLIGRTGRGVALAVAILAAVGFVATPRPAHAISAGEAAGIGLGAFALGTLLSQQPYYSPYYYPGYGYPGSYYGYPGYYAPPYTGRMCWDPYYRRYYYC
jgi:hypothetical protein